MRLRLVSLPRPKHEQGLCWTLQAPAECGASDDPANPMRSTLRLFEDGREIGPAHIPHQEVRTYGGGRFSHWADRVYLSTAAPGGRANLHSYTALVAPPGGSETEALFAAAAAVDPAALDREQRYAWAERLFAAFEPEIHLPEWGRSFLRDAAFRTDYERFDRGNYRSYDRKFTLREMLKLALRQPGDLAECGVFRGATAYLAAKAIVAEGSGRRLHLFDSFEGLSAPRPGDGDFWRAGSMACSAEEVAANLGNLVDVTLFHPGWIPTRFGEVADRRFCFLHLDVDLHQPTLDSLRFFYPRMMPGGVILCDDYGFDTCPGARRAMDEFFADLPEPILSLPTGQGLVLIEPRATG